MKGTLLALIDIMASDRSENPVEEIRRTQIDILVSIVVLSCGQGFHAQWTTFRLQLLKNPCSVKDVIFVLSCRKRSMDRKSQQGFTRRRKLAVP